MKLSGVSGQICPGSCCMLRTMMKNATASRHTRFFWETLLYKLQTRLLATPFIHPSFCICLCSRLSVALCIIIVLYFPPACWKTCSCYIYTLEVRVYSRNGVGWQCQASVHNLHRNGASQNLQQAGRCEWFSCCWNIWDTIACVADEPGNAEILFSGLEKSSMILIINYFWCILIFFFFLIVGQVTCTDKLQLIVEPSTTELVTKVYIWLFIWIFLFWSFCIGLSSVLAFVIIDDFRWSSLALVSYQLCALARKLGGFLPKCLFWGQRQFV